MTAAATGTPPFPLLGQLERRELLHPAPRSEPGLDPRVLRVSPPVVQGGVEAALARRRPVPQCDPWNGAPVHQRSATTDAERFGCPHCEREFGPDPPGGRKGVTGPTVTVAALLLRSGRRKHSPVRRPEPWRPPARRTPPRRRSRSTCSRRRGVEAPAGAVHSHRNDRHPRTHDARQRTEALGRLRVRAHGAPHRVGFAKSLWPVCFRANLRSNGTRAIAVGKTASDAHMSMREGRHTVVRRPHVPARTGACQAVVSRIIRPRKTTARNLHLPAAPPPRHAR